MKPCNIILPTGISFLILTAIAMTGCKTSEANYRAAYQTAKTASADGIDSTIYARIRQEAVPTAVLADGDSVRTQGRIHHYLQRAGRYRSVDNPIRSGRSTVQADIQRQSHATAVAPIGLPQCMHRKHQRTAVLRCG